MAYGIKLRVWGDYACFTRPELKAERVSYEVITPSAAVGILESIHWKPAIKWVIDRIHVYKPVKYDCFMRNELSDKISPHNVRLAMNGVIKDLHQIIENERQQRSTMLLRDVEYVIEAHFELTESAGEMDTEEKHYAQFMRRARKGGCYAQPYFGCREFVAYFELIEGEIPPSSLLGEKDFGLMLHSIDYANNNKALFYNVIMHNGVINVPYKVVI